MNTIFFNRQTLFGLFPYLIVVSSCVAFITVCIIAVYKDSNGHLLQWCKDIPLIFKIGIALFLVVIVTVVSCTGYTIFRISKYLLAMHKGEYSVAFISNYDENYTVVDALYRGDKIGNNIIIYYNGTELHPMTILSDNEVSQIRESDIVEIDYGFIGGDIEIWKIVVHYEREESD